MLADFDKKENRKFFNKKLLFKVFGIIFIILIAVLAAANFKFYQKRKDLEKQIAAYQRQIEDIKKNSQTLKDEIKNSDNPNYLEKIAYEQFNLARPGEIEYIFVKPENDVEQEHDQSVGKSFTGWLSGVLEWIKSKF